MKNINPLERHIEKIVLGIGVLFAGWLIYKNFVHDPYKVASPVQPGSMIAATNIGSQITSQVDLLEQAIKKQKNRPINIGRLPDYVENLVGKQTAPLAPKLVALRNLGIGPDNMPLELKSGPQTRGLIFMTASVPALAQPQAGQSQAVVYLPSASNSAAGAASGPVNFMSNFANPNNANGTAGLSTKGMFWVTLKTNFPMAKWIERLAAKNIKLAPNQAALPLSYQITSFYRVQVRRQHLLPDGRWSAWQRITGLNIDSLPKLNFRAMTYSQRSSLLAQLNGIVEEILDPAFYAIQQVYRRAVAPPQNVQRPRPSMSQTLQPPGMPNFPGMPGMPGMPGGFPGASIPQPQVHPRQPQQPQAPALSPFQVHAQQSQQVQLPPLLLPGQTPQTNGAFPGTFAMSGTIGANGVNSNTAAAGPTSLTEMPSVPVRFYDTHVIPGEIYRYEIRVVMYNPVYGFPNRLNRPALRKVQWLKSPWSAPSESLRVNSDLYFFITGAEPARGIVSFQLFRWVHGQWLDGSQRVRLGESIGDKESISVIKSNGTLAPKIVNFATGHILVDAVESVDNQSVNVVIEGPDHNLHLRNSALDAADPQERKLFELSNEIGPPPPAGGGQSPPP